MIRRLASHCTSMNGGTRLFSIRQSLQSARAQGSVLPHIRELIDEKMQACEETAALPGPPKVVFPHEPDIKNVVTLDMGELMYAQQETFVWGTVVAFNWRARPRQGLI